MCENNNFLCPEELIKHLQILGIKPFWQPGMIFPKEYNKIEKFTENPKNIDNYIVDKGAEGVSLGWWNGTEWIKMWGSEKINVYGWIQMPIHKEQILNQNK